MGRRVPSEETVRAGCPGQLRGPGLAHQAAAAHHQRQHSCQPQVFKAGVYELHQNRTELRSECMFFSLFQTAKLSGIKRKTKPVTAERSALFEIKCRNLPINHSAWFIVHRAELHRKNQTLHLSQSQHSATNTGSTKQ